jgi:Clostripain family
MSNFSKTWTFLLYIGLVENEQEVDTEPLLAELRRFAGPLSDVECIYQVAFPTHTLRARVVGGEKHEELSHGPPIDITNPRHLTEFVDWATRHYPSRFTALCLKDHGTGLEPNKEPHLAGVHTTGIFYNGKTHHYMSTIDLRTAIERSNAGRVDVYGLDACNMMTVELAYELRNVCSYLIGSYTIMDAHGWPYADILKHLQSAGATLSPRSLARYIADKAKPAASDGWAIAADLSWSSTLSAAIDTLARALDANMDSFAPFAAKLYSFPTDMAELTFMLTALQKREIAVTESGDVEAIFKKLCINGKGLGLFFPTQSGSLTFGFYGAYSFARANYWPQLVSHLNQELLLGLGS